MFLRFLNRLAWLWAALVTLGILTDGVGFKRDDLVVDTIMIFGPLAAVVAVQWAWHGAQRGG